MERTSHELAPHEGSVRYGLLFTTTLGIMSPTAWDLAKLRTHLCSTDPNFDLVNEVLRSLGQNFCIFRYHMATARDALNGIVDQEHPAGPENFRLIFGASEKSDEFNFARIVSEAHLVSCLQTARGMWDHFAQLLNLVVLGKSIPISKCDISPGWPPQTPPPVAGSNSPTPGDGTS